MLTLVLFGISALFGMTYSYYPQEHLYFITATFVIATFITAIAETALHIHNKRCEKESEEYLRRINDMSFGELSKHKSNAFSVSSITGYPLRNSESDE